jgi:hypothetical protein
MDNPPQKKKKKIVVLLHAEATGQYASKAIHY